MPSASNMNDSLTSLRDRSRRALLQSTSPELKLNASFAQQPQVFLAMKNTLTFTLCLVLSCLTLSAAPQLSNVVTSSTDAPLGYWLEVEEVAVHAEGELAGQTTYRLAMHMLNDDDFLSSCSGDAENPMVLESSTGEWYNHPANQLWNASGINPAVFGSFPDLAFDSYLTLGATTAGGIHPEYSSGDVDWTNEFLGATPMGSNINTAGDVFGFLWYNLPEVTGDGTHSGIAANHEDLKVPVAQITTAGTLSGQMTVQIFENGDPNNEIRMTFLLCSSDGECGTCTDPEAINYVAYDSASVFYDDGSCIAAVPGCNAPAACNYNPEANTNDGSCIFEDALGECGGPCLADADEDGICDDADECVGAVDECGVCNGPGAGYFCGSDFNNLPIRISSTCGEDEFAPGLTDDFQVVLSPSGYMNAVVDGSEVIMGEWTEDLCACTALLEFYDGDCAPLQIEIDVFGYAEQINAEPLCCFSVNHDVETFCASDFLNGLTDQAVECEEDLPLTCDPEAEALNICDQSDVFCSVHAFTELGTSTHTLTTADGPGPDAVLRIYGLGVQTGAASDYFLEDPANPLTLTRYHGSGTAHLQGAVLNANDPAISFDVDIYFESEQNAAEWLEAQSGADLLSQDECDIDAAQIQVYTLKNTMSRLVGTGSMAGELYLNHMPASQTKRFQLGDGANNHNCEYGFGGWFGWQGVLNGAPVSGLTGDIIADATAPEVAAPGCDGEYVELVYAAVDPVAGFSQHASQLWERVDTTAPVFLGAPEDETLEWSDIVGDTCDDWFIEVPCVNIDDNCADWNPDYPSCNTSTENLCGSVQFFEQVIEGSCSTQFQINRTWTATDDAGNVAQHTQIITVQDTEGPSFDSVPADVDIACGDLNFVPVQPEDCADYALTFTQVVEEEGCSPYGLITRTYTAVDGCGNETTFVQTLHTVDDQSPILDLDDSLLDMSCGAYSEDAAFGLTVTDCSLVEWTETDGAWSGEATLAWSLAGDDIDSPVEVSWVDSEVVVNDGGPCYTVNREITAVDRCGNVTIENFTLTVSDTEAPNLWASYVFEVEHTAYEGNGSMMVTADMQDSVVGEIQAQFWVLDACILGEDASLSVTWEDVAVTPNIEPCLGLSGDLVYTRTYTAIDPCGNTATATQNVVLVDTQAPVWANPNESLDPMECTGDLAGLMADPSFMLNEGGAVEESNGDVTFDVQAVLLGGGCAGTWYRQWTATDECGNVSYAEQFIPVVDETSPEFLFFPEDVTLVLDASGNADSSPEAVGGLPVAADNCANYTSDLTPTFVDSEVEWLCGVEGEGSYQIQRTWSVSDICGNVHTQMQEITFEDSIAPTLEGDNDIDVACDAYDEATSYITASQEYGDFELTWETNETSGGCVKPVGQFARVYSATDACGNVETFIQFITLVDEVAPQFDFFPADETAECGEEVFPEPTATDNCTAAGDIVIVENREEMPGECIGSYSIVRTFTATDDCGNVSTQVQTITVVDTTAPTWDSFPEDLVSDCSDNRPFDSATATDGCSGPVDFTISVDTLEGDCAQSFTLVRTFVAIDQCGNETDPRVQTIEVTDTTAPVFVEVLPEAALTVECDNIPEAAVLTATDDCQTIVMQFTETVIPGACDNEYTLLREWVAADDCGNETNHVQTITVEDNTAPVVVSEASDLLVECDGEGNATELGPWLASGGGAVVVENCGDVTWTNNLAGYAVTCGGNAAITVRFTATDACGNTATTTATFTVVDTIDPEWNEELPPEYMEVECGFAPDAAVLTVTDNCGEIPVEFNETIGYAACPGNYTITRSWSAEDACGNSVAHAQVIQVTDTQAPVLTIPEDYMAECSDDHPFEDAIVVDNCTSDPYLEVRVDTLPGACSNNFVIQRRFVTADDCGNVEQASQFITIVDTTPPAFVEDLPEAEVTVECQDLQSAATLTASDNCDLGPVTVNFEEVRVDGSCNNEFTLTRTWDMVDECGNTNGHVQIVHVQDTTPPEHVGATEITIPAHEYAVGGAYPPDTPWEELGDLGEVPAWYSDNCSEYIEPYTLFDAPTSGGCALQSHPNFDENAATFIRTYTFTDACGNEGTGEVIIHLEDVTPPVFDFVPLNAFYNCASAVVLEDATAFDETDDDVTITLSVDSVDSFCDNQFVLYRTWTALDDCDNQTTATQIIIVSDEEAPTLIVPDSYTAECGGVHPMEDAEAFDSCGDVTLVTETDTTQFDCQYVVTRTFTATDACANVTTGVQTITVNFLPSMEFVSFPADYTAECDADHPLEMPEVNETCSIVTIAEVTDTISGACENEYTVTRTFTASDNCGNSSGPQTQTIQIVDTTAPVIEGGMDATVECDGDGNLAEYQAWLDSHAGANATDACSEPAWSHVENEFVDACAATGIRSVIFTATDACGNSASFTGNFTIEDTTPASFEGDLQLEFECTEFDMDASYVTVEDICGDVTLTWVDNEISGGCVRPVGRYLRLYTAVDECGNVSQYEQSVLLVDNMAPELTVPAGFTVECDVEIVYGDAMATDACSDPDITVELDTIPGFDACPNTFTIVRTFTATDDCGNESSAQQVIQVQDNTAPTLSVPASYSAECSDAHPLADAVFSDNCPGAELSVVTDTVPGDQSYVVRREFTAVDACGNSSSGVQTITISDTEPPVFVGDLPMDGLAECSVMLAADMLEAVDNCGVATVELVETEIAGDCAGRFTLERIWTATDNAGLSVSHTQILTVQDLTSPDLAIPSDYSASCSDVLVLEDATATDNCSEVTITLEVDTVMGACPNAFVMERKFTAMDDCGNTSVRTQTITVSDEEAPVFNEELPADMMVECHEVPQAATLTASDNCTEVVVVFTEDTLATGCDNVYTLTRTWAADDGCGHIISHTQTVEVTDVSVPEFSGLAGVENGATVTVPYNSIFGEVVLPVLLDPVANDLCGTPLTCDEGANEALNLTLGTAVGQDLALTYLVGVQTEGDNNPFSTEEGETEGNIMTPEVMDDGMTCDNIPEAFGLQLFNFMAGEHFVVDSGNAERHEDGTVHITMATSGIDDPEAKLLVEADFEELMTWEEWLETPGEETYKSDCGLGDHEEWFYTVMTSGSVVGSGSLEGTNLALSHQPANELFGYQFGYGANNKNANFGFSGWFYYTGEVVMDGVANAANGSGDLFGDLDFIESWSTTLTYCAVDCAGNETTFEYTIQSSEELVNPLSGMPLAGVQPDEGFGTPGSTISVESLFPNPTQGLTVLSLGTTERVDVIVELVDMRGAVVQDVFRGELIPNWQNTVNIDARSLSAGMYQIRILAPGSVTTKKLLLTE